MIARGGGKGEGQVVKGLNVSLPKPVAPARCSDAQGPGQGLRAAGISPPPLDVMELDLSPPQLSSSPEDLCPTPGTPPGTPPPQDAPLSGEVKRSQPLPIPTSRRLPEEERQATSLPSIPNPFPELCSPPSKTPILGGPSSARGLLPRDASCPHVSSEKGKAGLGGALDPGWI
ncbi:Hypothetical predicted protein [Marmota monax]|uniref:Uncharacterized protein n=1 Tax=Marmota monax TaxID=9995 RepID=A0A5E4ADS1_MARMO|nr:Hypothetical predicted protein [Marmota monax]